jgi:hypothetical protein
VCLGQRLLPDAKPHPILLSRCDKAVKLHRDKGCPIINTGGDPAKVGITEARVMTEYMVNKKGIEKTSIVEEGESRSTTENAVFVSRILKCINGTNDRGFFEGNTVIYLVTSPHHMARSSYVFKAVFEYYNYNVNIVEEPSADMLTPSEMKQWLRYEKRIIGKHLNDKMNSASPVIGRTGGFNIPIPEKEILNVALSTITRMLLM